MMIDHHSSDNEPVLSQKIVSPVERNGPVGFGDVLLTAMPAMPPGILRIPPYGGNISNLGQRSIGSQHSPELNSSGQVAIIWLSTNAAELIQSLVERGLISSSSVDLQNHDQDVDTRLQQIGDTTFGVEKMKGDTKLENGKVVALVVSVIIFTVVVYFISPSVAPAAFVGSLIMVGVGANVLSHRRT